MLFRAIVFTGCLLLAVHGVKAQSQKTLDALSENYQSCLDKGDNMRGCAAAYYFKVDTLLNTVYKKIIRGLDSTNRVQLKAEQRKWLLERDAEFAKIKRKHKPGGDDANYVTDADMFILDEEASFVAERVSGLLTRYTKVINSIIR